MQRRFELSFLTNSQVAQPNTPATFTLVLRNLGNTTTTYLLSLEGLSPGLTGQFSQDQVTLAPGEVTTAITVTLTPDPTADLTALGFRVRSDGRGGARRDRDRDGHLHGAGRVRLRGFGDDRPDLRQHPAEQVHVTARVLNAVNREQTARATFVVRDAANQVVFTSQPVDVTLGVS